MSEWTIYTDASLVPNVSVAGAWVIKHGERIYEKHSIDLHHCGSSVCLEDINFAELYIIKAVLTRLRVVCLGQPITLLTDSQSAIRQIVKNLPARSEAEKIVSTIRNRIKSNHPNSRIGWIPRSKNKAADMLASRNREKRSERILIYHESGSVTERNVERFKGRIFSDCTFDGAIKRRVR